MHLFLNTEHPLVNASAAEVPLHEIPLQPMQKLIEHMYDIAQSVRTDISQKSMAGLAAPQIGVNKRVILIDMGMDAERRFFGTLKAFINPEIIWHSKECLLEDEHCFYRRDPLSNKVPRFERIKIIAYDRLGNPLEQELSGYTARLFQHEIGHLDGFCLLENS